MPIQAILDAVVYLNNHYGKGDVVGILQTSREEYGSHLCYFKVWYDCPQLNRDSLIATYDRYKQTVTMLGHTRKF